jgi:predicted acylesterase/phospholipase RssA
MSLVSADDTVMAGSKLATFIDTIVGGNIAEKQPLLELNYLGLEEIKSFLMETGSIGDQLTGFETSRWIWSTASQRLFFTTAEGLFGLGPRFSMPGDVVAVILSCTCPLILRPVELSGKKSFRIVGHCYISEMMTAEGLLGPLPVGWSPRQEENGRVVFTNGDTYTQQDPRMPLPPGWSYRYGDWETPQETEAKGLEDMTEQWFENVETGEKSEFDPRLTPEFLMGKGLAIEELILI